MPKPQLDVVTRWGSSFIMLKRLLQLKDFCLNNISTTEQLSSNEWLLIANILEVLEPVNELTLKLQTSQLILGDFYKFCMGLNFTLKEIKSDISNKLLSSIESRQESLLENDTMYAAIFLDPRFRRPLSGVKQDAAKRHLKKLFYQLQNLEKVNNL